MDDYLSAASAGACEDLGGKTGDDTRRAASAGSERRPRTAGAIPSFALSVPPEEYLWGGDGDAIREILKNSDLIPTQFVANKVQPLDCLEDSDDEYLSDDESYEPLRDGNMNELNEGRKTDELAASEPEAVPNTPKVKTEDTTEQTKYDAMGAKPKVFSPKGTKRKLSHQKNEAPNDEHGKRHSPSKPWCTDEPNCCCDLCVTSQLPKYSSVTEITVTRQSTAPHRSHPKTTQTDSDTPHYMIAAEKGIDDSIPVATAEQVKTAIEKALKSCNLAPQESKCNPSNTKEEMSASFTSVMDFLMPSTSTGTRRVYDMNAEKSHVIREPGVGIPFTLGSYTPNDDIIIPKLQPQQAAHPPQKGQTLYKNFTLPDGNSSPSLDPVSPPTINPFRGCDLIFNSARQTKKIDYELLAKSKAVRKLDFTEPINENHHYLAMKLLNRSSIKHPLDADIRKLFRSETGVISGNMMKPSGESALHALDRPLNLSGKAAKLETEKSSVYPTIESVEQILAENFSYLFDESVKGPTEAITENVSNKNLDEGLEEIKASLESFVNTGDENVYETSIAYESKNCKDNQPNKAVGLVSDNHSENQLDNQTYIPLNETAGHETNSLEDYKIDETVVYTSDNHANEHLGEIVECPSYDHSGNNAAKQLNSIVGDQPNKSMDGMLDEVVIHSSDDYANNQLNETARYPSDETEDPLSETVGDPTDRHVDDQFITDGSCSDGLADGFGDPETKTEANVEEDIGCAVCERPTTRMCGRKRVCDDCRAFFADCVLAWDWQKHLMQDCRALPEHPENCRWCFFRKCLRAGLLTQTVIEENAKRLITKEARLNNLFATLSPVDFARELRNAHETTFETDILDNTAEIQLAIQGRRRKMVQFFFNLMSTTYLKLRQFCNKIPGFMELDADRVYLVNSSIIDLFLMQIFFNDMYNKNMVLLPDGTLACTSELFRAFPEIVAEVKHFGDKLAKNPVDYFTALILRCMVLLSDRAGLRDRQLVNKLYTKAVDALRYHIYHNYDRNFSDDYLVHLLLQLGTLRAIAAKFYMYIRSVAFHVKIPVPDYLLMQLHRH